MLKKRLHCFSKYPHIYVFIGKGEKTKEEIKSYLMQRLGLSEATARKQIEVALAEEHGSLIFVETNGNRIFIFVYVLFRLNQG